MTDEERNAIRQVLMTTMVAIEDAYRDRDLAEAMPGIISALAAVLSHTARAAGLSSYQFARLCENARVAEWPDNPRT